MKDLPDDFNDAIVALPLANSPEICLINFSDYERCSKHNWNLDRHTGYPLSKVRGRTKTLSKFITRSNFTDHIDRVKLNNTRNNLRKSTHQQNCWNKEKKKGCSSIYIGVYYSASRKYWIAQLKLNGKHIHLGCFNTEVEAAKAYNEASIKYHGNIGVLNSVS